MEPLNACKIDLGSDYPCPCRRQGHLVPIALTEALGCQRCQQIFVVSEDGYLLEQLPTGYAYPYRRTWCWTGQQWNAPHRKADQRYWSLGCGFIVLIPLLIGLPLLLLHNLRPDLLFWVVMLILLALVPALIAWFTLYRQ